MDAAFQVLGLNSARYRLGSGNFRPFPVKHEKTTGGFPGLAVVKNPPANAGDTGSRPGPGRSHMPRSN